MSEISFHRLIQKDLDQVLNHYTIEGGKELADNFFAEAELMVSMIASNPERFHFVGNRFRRANFKKFPYHFLFEEVVGGFKIVILRHHSRSPKYGLRRR